jgi:hypothetical protein
VARRGVSIFSRSEHILEQRIQLGIVDVRREYAFLQVIENHDAARTAQAAKSGLMQFGPGACKTALLTAATMASVEPVTVQMFGEFDVKLTAKPELAVALIPKGAWPKVGEAG